MNLDCNPWIARIEALVPGLLGVGGAADLAAAIAQPSPRTPWAYVIPLRMSGGANQIAVAGVSQRMTDRIGIVTAVRNVASASGQKSLDELTPLRQAQLQALVGWTPDENHEEVVFAHGQLVDFSNRVLWWQDEYTVDYYRQEFTHG